jgi:hypothetical protein
MESSDHQADGIATISGSVEEASLVTQRSAAGAEESSATAVELDAQSQRLRQLVGSFVLDAGEEVEPTRDEEAGHGERSDGPSEEAGDRLGDDDPRALVAALEVL